MTCDDFIDRASGLLDGGPRRLFPDDVRAHFEECSDCRDLLAALAATRHAPDDPELSTAILARTSGNACVSAQPRLCAWLDAKRDLNNEELDPVEAELVAEHVRWCDDCAGLARVLDVLSDELPLLAHEDPGPRFLENVLSRTSRRKQSEPVGRRIGGWLSRLLDRPRIAWEGAFVATFGIVLPVMGPDSPLSNVPNRAIDLARQVPPAQRRAIGELRGVVNEVESSLAFRLSAARSTTGEIADEESSVFASAARLSSSAWDSIRRGLGTLPQSDASGGESGATGTSDRGPATAEENRR